MSSNLLDNSNFFCEKVPQCTQRLEQLLSDPHFRHHSLSSLLKFYRELSDKKRSNIKCVEMNSTLNSKMDSKMNAEAHGDPLLQNPLLQDPLLKQLERDHKRIYESINPLEKDATLQEVMRYHIDIYDANILQASQQGISIIPMNTGNPTFRPFSPINQALQKASSEALTTFSKYIMQVPEMSFCNTLTQYCLEENILPASKKRTTTLTPANVVVGNGSTNLYYLALKTLIKNKGDIVLMTSPTYGLFIDPVFTAGGEVGFLNITEKTGWKLDPKTLDETIQFYNAQAFYQYILDTFQEQYEKLLETMDKSKIANKLMPTMPNIDSIKGRAEKGHAEFDEYILKLNAFVESSAISRAKKEKLKFTCPPRVRILYHMNPHNPTGAVYARLDLEPIASLLQHYPEISVIDDLAHWGILYDNASASAFSSFENLHDRVITLMSLSKAYGVPGLRAGLAIGCEEVIKKMQYALLNSSSSASVPAVIALEAVLSSKKTDRIHYLSKNNQEYLFKRDLMACLINGFKNVNLPFETKMKLYRFIIDTKFNQEGTFDKSSVEAIATFETGIPLIRTLTDPKGCFFHLLDVSKLIGARLGSIELATATDIRNAIHTICKVDTVPGELSGNFLNPTLRLSFSLTEQQIVIACQRIRSFVVEYVLKLNPRLGKELKSQQKTQETQETLAVHKKTILHFYSKTLTQSSDPSKSKKPPLGLRSAL